MDLEYYYNKRRGLTPFDYPGLVRVDRALLYFRQQLDALITELNAKNTKGLGESYYGLIRIFRGSIELFISAGDRYLADRLRNLTAELNYRSDRKDTVKNLNVLKNELEAYQPKLNVEELESLSKRISELEEKESDNPDEGTHLLPESLSDKNAVFVIMPFNNEFNDVWVGAIQPASKTFGYTPIRVDMINKSANITDDIIDSINKCKIAVVDVTGGNPNVMYELGYAMAKEKPYIIISQSVDSLPFDIKGIRTILYTNSWSGIENLKKKIEEFFKESKPKKENITAKKKKR